MAVESSEFGGVVLTDDDAREFERQVYEQPAPKAAIEAARDAHAVANRLIASGFVSNILG